MKKKKIDPLDNLVREKLSNLEVPYAPFAWELLEQKMDAANASVPPTADRSLDEVIFAKLHNMEAGDRPAHWNLLAAKLDENVDTRRKVLIYKVMEMAAVFLLLLLAGQYLTNSFNNQSPIAEKTNIKSELNNSAAIATETLECNENPTQIIAAAETNNEKPSFDNHKPLNATNNKSKAIADFKINSIIAGTEQSEQSLSNTPEILIQGYRESPQIGNKPLQKQRSTQEISMIQKGLSSMKPSDLLNPVQPERWDILTSIDELVVSELQYKSPTDYTMLIKTIKKRPNVIVSMLGSADYNHIITPVKYEGDQRLEETRRYAPGYGGGITAGLELGRWEVSTGAIYTSKEYQPRQVLYATGNVRDGYFIEGIKNIQLNTFNIPLYLRYNFIFHDKWRAYATAGLSLQVAFQADYYIGDGDDFRNQGVLLPTTQREPGFGEDPLDESKLPKGFFEGGTLWENGYITGNVGLGLERYITGRWSVFAQPTYHQSLKYFTHGLGPDKDRIHTMSLFTGVRVRLSN